MRPLWGPPRPRVPRGATHQEGHTPLRELDLTQVRTSALGIRSRRIGLFLSPGSADPTHGQREHHAEADHSEEDHGISLVRANPSTVAVTVTRTVAFAETPTPSVAVTEIE